MKDIRNYIRKGKLWQAFQAEARPILLIDEIDKADIEFPNDLLQELDRMEFFVDETGEVIKAGVRPIVFITSNNEKELPDAFLRRCFFHYIRFPDRETMQTIVDVHYPGLKPRLLTRGAEYLLRYPRRARHEEAVYVGAARLDQAVALGGYRPRTAQGARPEEAHPAARRCAYQE